MENKRKKLKEKEKTQKNKGKTQKNKQKAVKNVKKTSKNSKNASKNRTIENESVKKNNAKRERKSGFVWFLSVSTLAVCLLLVCQFFFASAVTADSKFYKNTKINGIDVGGMTMAEAENAVLTKMLENKGDVRINLSCGDKRWQLKGGDFEVANGLQKDIKTIASYGKTGNYFENLKNKKEIEKNGKDFNVSYASVLAGVEEKIEEVASEVEREQKEARLVFAPNNENPFSVDAGQSAVIVLRDELRKRIDEALLNQNVVDVEIPIVEIEAEFNEDELLKSVVKRSEFSTDYSKSTENRKNNVRRALESFNGLVVESGQTVSFNEITGARTEENGYKNAHIIYNGVYVDGVGGGVCQASTTLYNALLLAGIKIDKVFHHSLPASYVPLSFDAMVSGGDCDLVFTNNLEKPIYIKCSAGNEKVTVEIYGQDMDGVKIERRAELVKILPHNGDQILPDEKEEYANKILYKGEFYRVKWPKEGYESKGYLRYYKDGEFVEEKEIRHDFYRPQDGVVMEGTSELGVGMTLPASEVAIVSPQKVTSKTEESARARLTKI